MPACRERLTQCHPKLLLEVRPASSSWLVPRQPHGRKMNGHSYPRGKTERRRNQPLNPRSPEPLRVPVLSLGKPDQAGPGSLPSRAARTRPAPGAKCRGRAAIGTARSAGNLGLKNRDREAGNERRGKRKPMGATPPS